MISNLIIINRHFIINRIRKLNINKLTNQNQKRKEKESKVYLHKKHISLISLQPKIIII